MNFCFGGDATESSHLLDFLTGEFRQPLGHVLPGLVAIDERLERLKDFVLAGTDLLGGVAVAEGEGLVLDRLEIDGDTERSAQLVVAGITLADTGRRVVHAAGDTQSAQFRGQGLDERFERGVGRERDQEHLGRGNSRGEGKNLGIRVSMKSRNNEALKNGWTHTPRASSPARDQ